MLTRDFAAALPNAVVFDIEYRLAPMHRFPAAVEDCWQAYAWLVLNVEKVFGIKYKKLIVMGDSAGGTLALCMTAMAIERNFKVPDFVMPLYPATSISHEHFYPSLINLMDDFILTTKAILFIMKVYMPEGQPLEGSTNPYLSPSKISDEVLAKFPPIKIITGGIDPLRDDSVLLLHRLLKNKAQASIIEMKNMPHGFLSLGNKKKGEITSVDKAKNIVFDILKQVCTH